MEEGNERVARGRGCIKSTRGPWIVRRRGKAGVLSASLRRPSDQERENNRQREQQRRRVAKNIYSGLRQHGNYHLPKHPDRNDILIALCEEAGYHVDEDGNITRKCSTYGEPSGAAKSFQSAAIDSRNLLSNSGQPEIMEELSLDLTISFKYM